MARHFLHETPAREGRVLASGGVPVHDDWEQFHSFVTTHFGPEDAALFAEPWKNGGATSWLHEEVQGARPLGQLSPEEQAPVRARLDDLWARMNRTSAEMLASARPDERHWGEVLGASLRFPSKKGLEEAVYVRDGQPLLVNWGMQDDASVTLFDLLQAPPAPPLAPPEPVETVPPAPDTPPEQPIEPQETTRRGWLFPLWLLWLLIAAGLLLLLFLLWMLLRAFMPSLGLPNLPGMPDLSGFSAPDLSMPALPSLPEMPGFPGLPAMPSLPDLPTMAMPSLGGLPQLGASPALAAEQARHSELMNRLAALREQAVGLDHCSAVVPPAAPETPVPPEAPAQTEIDRAREEASGQVGDVTVTLKWAGHADLDLGFSCPLGGVFTSYEGRGGASVCGGGIDLDANLCMKKPTNPNQGCISYEKPPTDTPLENGYFVSGTAQSGTYGVFVRNYAGAPQDAAASVPFELQVRIGDKVETFSGQLEPSKSATVTTFTLE